MPELKTPILIVGGGTGGVAAALAVARAGQSCVLTEQYAWIGGQLTTQGVPPDENRWIEGDTAGTRGATRSYIAYRDAVRAWYREKRPLTDAARADKRLNPGHGWVSHLCHKPRIGLEVLGQMLKPHVDAGRVKILTRVDPIAADVQGDRVRSVTFRHQFTREQTTVEADYILEATETGDLLPLAKIEYRVGAEDQRSFAEMHAPAQADPNDQQAITWCFAVEHRPGENHTIDKPASYDFWRSYVPPFTDVPWPGKLFSWTIHSPGHDKARDFRLVPWPDEPAAGEWELWRYRRIVDTTIYPPEHRAELPDVSLFNSVQMDYFQKPTLDVTAKEKEQALAEARDQSLAWLYWMQTEAPRHDGKGLGYPGLKLRGNELGTKDGLAMAPYIRESRRIVPKFTVAEPHVGFDQRRVEKRPGMDKNAHGMAEPFADSVGIGHYRMDLHPTTSMKIGIYAQACPFRIPLGALLPQRVTNVIAAGKCLGVTHITNGAYRLHPVEWNIGEAAGALAAYCVAHNATPHGVHASESQLRAFQHRLVEDGFELAWPWESGAGLAV
jgi:hypothetical protein